ncbi:hypothetical protein BG20_I2108 [Candidatus Nitrosarchaeum limnium BG20]|jgi:hypothetical protein|uniref:Uncharacterized protein n=1 Tax=Candidatus Nitrosarchaeum limnium BG20 TaxID=859192 RepID=S2ENW7_9ARCH|nr:hypothetical protein BG20_I2108 [Candidatus Nitrosarchaeum limnium BG20]
MSFICEINIINYYQEMFDLSNQKAILYHLHVIDEDLDECEDLSEYSC